MFTCVYLSHWLHFRFYYVITCLYWTKPEHTIYSVHVVSMDTSVHSFVIRAVFVHHRLPCKIVSEIWNWVFPDNGISSIISLKLITILYVQLQALTLMLRFTCMKKLIIYLWILKYYMKYVSYRCMYHRNILMWACFTPARMIIAIRNK